MGYETKLMIGLVVDFNFNRKPSRKAKWFQIYAELDLCKLGSKSPLFDLMKKVCRPEVYWYKSDGNTREMRDRYGDCFKPVPIRDVLAALQADPDATTYRRIKWAIGLLEEMVQDKEDDISVVFFGH